MTGLHWPMHHLRSRGEVVELALGEWCSRLTLQERVAAPLRRPSRVLGLLQQETSHGCMWCVCPSMSVTQGVSI